MNESPVSRPNKLDWLKALSAAVAVAGAAAPLSAQAAAPVQMAVPACQPWQASIAYSKDDTATQNNRAYRANWWTQGDDPATHSGPAGSGQPAWSTLRARSSRWTACSTIRVCR